MYSINKYIKIATKTTTKITKIKKWEKGIGGKNEKCCNLDATYNKLMVKSENKIKPRRGRSW